MFSTAQIIRLSMHVLAAHLDIDPLHHNLPLLCQHLQSRILSALASWGVSTTSCKRISRMLGSSVVSRTAATNVLSPDANI